MALVPAAGPASRYAGWHFLACTLILIAAQALVGMLSLSALDRLVAANTADRVELAARQSAARIQGGLDLGKPLAQYFGLDDALARLQGTITGFSGAAVVLPDGRLLAAVGDAPTAQDATAALATLHVSASAGQGDDAITSAARRPVARERAGSVVRLGIPLTEPGQAQSGALLVDVTLDDASRGQLLKATLVMLALVTGAAVVLLILVLRPGALAWAGARQAVLRRLAPALILLVAQAGYTAYTVHTFRTHWLDVAHDNAHTLVRDAGHDLERVLGYGIAPDRITGIDRYLHRIVASFPMLAELRLLDADGRTVASSRPSHQATGAQRSGAVALSDGIRPRAGPQGLTLGLRTSSGAAEAAFLDATFDSAWLRAGVWQRALEAGTVAIIAVVMAMELLRLLERAAGRRRPGGLRPGASDTVVKGIDPRLARPVMFGMVFAWAMPLGFLPLYARSLLADSGSDAAPFLMALPIAAEMGCGLIMALLAGRLSDRRGWQRPVCAGLGLLIVGSIASGVAASLESLAVARALIGLGYGLSWMGLQGFVVLHSPSDQRGRIMADLLAGLFAGHLSGVAVGAMMKQYLGAAAVFYGGALLFLLPLAGVVVLVRRAGPSQAKVPPVSPLSPPRTAMPARGWRRLLASRDFGALLACSVVPFSLAQVGLLNFALPLYMEASGAHAAAAGQVLMLYGLCIIYLGPWMGRLADRSVRKKSWIGVAGGIGGAGMAAPLLLSGAWGAVIAVIAMAVSGAMLGGAQTSYMLALDEVQRYGAVGATSVMRAADKVGQMLGPLLMAALFMTLAMPVGLAMVGLLYGGLAVVFMRIAPPDWRPRGARA